MKAEATGKPPDRHTPYCPFLITDSVGVAAQEEVIVSQIVG